MQNTMAKPITAVRAAVVVAARSRWARTICGSVLAVLGLSVLLVELVRYWTLNHPIHAWPVCIGCVIGFVGFFIVNPKEAKDGAQVVVDSTVRVIGVVRGGRRATDPKVVVADATNTEDRS